MTLARRIALVLGGLVLLFAAALAVFVATFDADRYKGLAIDAMQQKYQRTLAIDGPIRLSVFPRLAVKLGKLRLSEHARPNDEFAAIDEASLSLQVLPLLRKQFVVDRLAARGVRATLARNAKGGRNIDDLLAKDASAAAPAGGPAPRFDIGGVQLEDARLVLRDDLAKVAGTITLASFESGRLAPGVETKLALKAAIELTQPQALSLALEGTTLLVFDLDRGSATLGAVALRASGDTAAVKALDARLDAKRLAYSPEQQQLELEAAKLTLAGRQGKSPFEASLEWPRLAVAGERLQGSGFSGRFKLQGANALAGTFQSGNPSGSFEALRLPGFTLRIDGSAGPRKVDGDLKANLLLRPGKTSVALDKLVLRANVVEPGLQPLRLAVDGNAGVDGRGAQWTLAGSLNTNQFSSNGSAAFGGAVPNVQATARFDRLDLNQVLAPGSTAPAPSAAAPADTAVAFDGLAAVNGRFALSAGQLVFRQYKVADAKLDAALDGGTLRVARLTGGAWGGQIDASGSAQAQSKRVAVKLAASGVNVNALLKDVAGKDLLEGTGRVTADLTTGGASLGALRSNLAGSAALNLRDGAIKGVNLARSFRQAKAAFSLKQDALAKAQASEKTDFSELTATAQIANGVAQSKDLDVKSPFLRLGGAGTFDIGRGRIDYTARATVVGVPAGQDAAEMAALRGVTVPVLLSGPFEAIDWRIQWSAVAAAAVENKLKDRLAEKLGAKLGAAAPATAAAASAPRKPEDNLKDALRGLFKK
ncbi:MAG TPA: AsmA family protein [Burkholderiaceae bacterium]|nr:AsmA family protein [Burkholderiaceae bacterium]